MTEEVLFALVQKEVFRFTGLDSTSVRTEKAQEIFASVLFGLRAGAGTEAGVGM